MTRVQWRLFALTAAALTVASAWFALNGSRIARPGPGTLAEVQLPAESPSLPPSDAAPRPAPAPLARALFGTNGDPLATGDIASRILRAAAMSPASAFARAATYQTRKSAGYGFGFSRFGVASRRASLI